MFISIPIFRQARPDFFRVLTTGKSLQFENTKKQKNIMLQVKPLQLNN